MATQTITVSTTTELNQALSNATGGETILLAAGSYGKLVLKGTQYASDVTIKSADSSAMASFSEAYVTSASNITFDTIMFDYTYSSGDSSYTSKFRVENSSNITFTDSVFDGDFASGTGTSADGTGFGKGLVIRGSTNVEVINTEFHSWWKALGASMSNDITMIGNNIHTIRSDGISLGEVQNVLIENNYIHDFGGAAGSGDHRDMIQIQRSGGTGSSDIIIRNNILDMGAGDYTQGIWAGRDKASYSDPTNWNYNITIENNILYNAHANGIALHQTDGLNILNNTVIAVPDPYQTGGVTIPKIIISPDSLNVAVTGNVAPTIVGDQGQADWTLQNNALVATGSYDSTFTYNATGMVDGYNQYSVITGSLVDSLNAGSSLVDNYPYDYNSWVGSSSTVVSGSGSNTTGTGSTDTGGTDTGSTDTSGTDTGSTDTSDANAGGADTSGTDTGSTDTNDANAGGTDTSGTDTGSTQSPMVFDDFVLDIAGLPENGQAKLRDDATVVDTASGPAILFDGQQDRVELGRLHQFEESEQIAFTVEFTRAEADGSAQRLVWNKGHVGLTLVGDGLKAHVKNNDGKFYEGFAVDDLGLNDTDTHQITLMVDQVTDQLQVLVDGQLVLNETNTDFDFVGSNGGTEWGWNIGLRNRDVDGLVSGFAIDDDVQFVDTSAGLVDDFLV
ncbi:right-handed parallel beta-helix repeat-containing protein [Roseovarius pacificus]|uniref:right-handed parallel beta-helix repeat-containing protein n=1 Tax=Roseovarius pacificus TaxID=337701 RepID=UPI002A18D987|nr:right-handed parallel beta-helix repeat-containing protein [Roseovarius pacificus]